LVEIIEEADYSVEKVARISVAMSYLAKWMLTTIHIRRLEFYRMPMESHHEIGESVLDRLPAQLERRKVELIKLQ